MLKIKVETNENTRYLSTKELQNYLTLGRVSAEKVGKEANARIKIGTRVLWDKTKIDAYMETQIQ